MFYVPLNKIINFFSQWQLLLLQNRRYSLDFDRILIFRIEKIFKIRRFYYLWRNTYICVDFCG